MEANKSSHKLDIFYKCLALDAQEPLEATTAPVHFGLLMKMGETVEGDFMVSPTAVCFSQDDVVKSITSSREFVQFCVSCFGDRSEVYSEVFLKTVNEMNDFCAAGNDGNEEVLLFTHFELNLPKNAFTPSETCKKRKITF